MMVCSATKELLPDRTGIRLIKIKIMNFDALAICGEGCYSILESDGARIYLGSGYNVTVPSCFPQSVSETESNKPPENLLM